MTSGRQWRRAALFLVLAAAGCVRTAEGPREEQKNPFFLAGKEKLQSMDYTGAAESFERALQDDPRSVLTHFELGVLYDQHLADYAAALYHYNKALKLRPAGYPADTIRYRIPACRQELVKADSLAVLNPSALREMEKLRDENQELRRQLGEAKAVLQAGKAASGPGSPGASGPSPASAPAVTTSAGPVPGRGAGQLSTGTGAAAAPGAGGTGATTAVRTHTVRSGETVASISRRYNVRLDAILAANRGLDPKRLKVGQIIQIPSR